MGTGLLIGAPKHLATGRIFEATGTTHADPKVAAGAEPKGQGGCRLGLSSLQLAAGELLESGAHRSCLAECGWKAPRAFQEGSEAAVYFPLVDCF